MRTTTIAEDLDPATLDLAEGEEVLAVGSYPILVMLENLRGTVRLALDVHEGERVRLVVSRKLHNLLLLARGEDLELCELLPLDGDEPGQVGTWCGVPLFMVEGDQLFPRLDVLREWVPLSSGTVGGAPEVVQ